MPTIEIVASAAGPAVRVDAAGPLLDVCDDARAPVEFSCRGASCGTCRVDVLAGAELLEPPGADELEVLRLAGATRQQRLACQAVVRAGRGTVRLRWVGG
jgi:ferredoxin